MYVNTKICKINDKSIRTAAEIIRSGDIVAFPTETVYGLGANAFDDEAVKKIFDIKGRPNDNPLIVHVHNNFDLNELVYDIPDYSKKLAKAFLPGPLTMVYKSRGKVSSLVSCGLDTLAIRVPAHEDCQKFLEYVNLPICAPSANLSKHVSPVTAQHVYDDLNGKIKIILDGGRCSGGIESTVLDCTGEVPVILRKGLISRDAIVSVTGVCLEHEFRNDDVIKSPGMKYKHYSPDAKTVLYTYDDAERCKDLYDTLKSAGEKVVILCDSSLLSYFSHRHTLDLGGTEEEIARNLYDLLRQGEKKADIILAVAPLKQDGIMESVMNRLSKACGE